MKHSFYENILLEENLKQYVILRGKIIITRTWQILLHNCPKRGGQLCDKNPWKRSMCNSWYFVTSLVAILMTGKWPPIDGRSNQRNILYEIKGRCY